MITNNIFKVFGRSPIKPLQTHMSISLQCAERLMDFFAAAKANDWERAYQVQQLIVNLENEADTIKQDIRSHLPKTLFMPIPREDILEILTMQDRLPNAVKDIAGLVLGRKMKLPAAIEFSYLQLLKRTIDCAAKIHQAINKIDELLETGFRIDEINLIDHLIQEGSQIEHDTDTLQIQVRLQLFQVEHQLSPIDVMFLYKVIELTGDIADRAEQIGERLQLLIAR